MDNEEHDLTPAFLTRLHNIIFPWPKASKLDWEKMNSGPRFNEADYFKEYKPIWKKLSQAPLDLQVPFADAEDYLEQCCGLIYLIDQTRVYFQGTDERYTRAFFDPACEKLALELFNSEHSPYKKETWLSRGWTFEDFIARIMCLWAPLIHSENVMVNHWDINKKILLYLREELEAYTGERDPYAATQDKDEQDLSLFSTLLSAGPTASDMTGFSFWMLRVMTSHRPITHKFGRYPYVNDRVGRDYAPGEEEWAKENPAMPRRMNDEVRKAIRSDVDNGTWSPLKLDYEYAG